MKKMLLNAAFCLGVVLAGTAQPDLLREKIREATKLPRGSVGVSLVHIEKGDTLSQLGRTHFPMQSVFKFPQAVYVMKQVEEGMLALDQKIYIKKEELDFNTWSPMAKANPEGNMEVTLDRLLTYSVAESDNNACDIIFKLIGGPLVVSNFIHTHGIRDMQIVATEKNMKEDWEVQFKNWATPIALTKLLRDFYQDKIVSEKSRIYLMGIMTQTTTGPNRIKGKLPLKTEVAHKTGTSGTNDGGISAATNDVGIITLPDGQHLALAVFITNSNSKVQTRERIIAEVARAAWNYYAVP